MLNLFSVFNIFTRNKNVLKLEELQTLQLIAQQVVISLDSVPISAEQKQELAFVQIDELLQEIGIRAPEAFVEVAISTGNLLLKHLVATNIICPS